MKIIHTIGWGIQEARPEGTLTGSHHIVNIKTTNENYKILLDIGSHPTNVANTQLQNPFEKMDVKSIDAVFISHVHQDHIWNCIQLVKAGYLWPIYMSEMSKYLARVIFDDALKHEKEEIEEYNRKIEWLQQELEDAWHAVRIHNHTPETRESKNPRKILSKRHFSLERQYEDKVYDILREFAIKKTKYRRRLKEILLDKEINEDELMGFLEEIPIHENKNEEKFIDDCVALKRVILSAQENYSSLELDDAQYKLRKYNIKRIEDIYAINERLAKMSFTENDVIQTLSQIVWLWFKKKIPIIADNLFLTIYSAWHVEGAALSIWEAKENNETKTFLFTGDLGRVKQPTLAWKPEIPHETFDYIITEWTYAGRTHNDRLSENNKIINDIKKAKDICLIPVFALQRLQDVLSMLVDAVRNKRIELGANEKIYCHSPLGYNLTKEFILHDTEGVYWNCTDTKIVKWIENPEEADLIVKKPGRKIIICSGGMLEQGTIAQYIDTAYANKNASILLTWFQVPGTNGYKILHSEFSAPLHMRNKLIKTNLAYVANYTLSGHADHDELKWFLTGMKYTDGGQITIVHGWPNRHVLAEDLRSTMPNITINVPEENGVSFEF